ncbi:ribbon-helix-helix domain-containing protein [Burkholderia vietnamiensis]|uniref:ribbon-helix-helix domain-containing protein n=1 Tax=Burkholderia vietnamiensis TaxID=60552 RepID=UPI001CB0B89D|nr:ribbon-helix-helix domain-containing protein [Burkholderia vietnamiensis]CAG9190893.1 conserved hypothetical protein [Burkholderia vietnamiensis]
MTNPARRSVRTSVLLSEDQHARLNEIANKSDVSVAWIIRQAVQQFLDRTANEQMPLPIRIVRGGEENV